MDESKLYCLACLRNVDELGKLNIHLFNISANASTNTSCICATCQTGIISQTFSDFMSNNAIQSTHIKQCFTDIKESIRQQIEPSITLKIEAELETNFLLKEESIYKNGYNQGLKEEREKAYLQEIKIAKLQNDLKKGNDFSLLYKGNGGMEVPAIDPHYIFPKETAIVMLDIIDNEKILLTGHTGTGKSSLIEQISARTNQGLIRVNLNSQINVSDFIGYNSYNGKEFYWIDGFLPKAMKEGLWIVLEEIDFAEAHILSLLNTMLEDNGKLFLKEKGSELIIPHQNFRLFATANTVGCMEEFKNIYTGTNDLNEAFFDRFSVYLINYLSPKDELNMLLLKFPKIPEATLEKFVKVANEMRKKFINGDIRASFSTRKIVKWIKMLQKLEGKMDLAVQYALFSKMNSTDQKVLKGVIETFFGE